MNEIVQKIVRPSALQLGMILGLLLALLFIFLDPGAKADSEINTTAENVAIEGCDTVAGAFCMYDERLSDAEGWVSGVKTPDDVKFKSLMSDLGRGVLDRNTE